MRLTLMEDGVKKTVELISQDRARRILAKAIEFDSDELTTIRELEIIAREVGISGEAFQAALTHDRETALPARPGRAKAWLTRTVVGAGMPLGFAAGWVLTHVPVFDASIPLFGIMTTGLAASAALIALEKTNPTASRFVLRNTLLWAGVAAGSLLAIATAGSSSVIELPWLYTLPASLRNWFISAVLGAVAVSVMESSAKDVGAGDAGDFKPAGWFGRAGVKLRRIIEVIVERQRYQTSKPGVTVITPG